MMQDGWHIQGCCDKNAILDADRRLTQKCSEVDRWFNRESRFCNSYWKSSHACASYLQI